jgi:hypothetical protein
MGTSHLTGDALSAKIRPAPDWRAFTNVVRFSLFVPHALVLALCAHPAHPYTTPHRSHAYLQEGQSMSASTPPAAPPLTVHSDPARAQGRR